MPHLTARSNLLLLGMFPIMAIRPPVPRYSFQGYMEVSLFSLLRFVEPWSDRAVKKSYCVFHPYSPAQLLPVKSNPKDGILHISVRANLKEDSMVTGSAHALFVKGFYIKEPGMVAALSQPLTQARLFIPTDS